MAKGKTRNFFVWIILGLLFVGLMGFGATGLSGRIRSVGTVGDLPIPVASYANELQQQMASASAQFGTQLSFAQAEAFGVPQLALRQVVSQRVLDNEMASHGISVGDDMVRQEVLSNPAFRGTDGSFDREQYRRVLQDNSLTESEYENSIRQDVTRAMLQSAVLAGLPEPDTYAETLATFIGEHRAFTWASVSVEDLEEPLPEPSEEALQTHYEENPEDFTTLETRALTYAWLTPEMIQDQVTVDEEELRQAYQDRIGEFVQPERRLVERLVYSSPEAAEAALARIEAGETDFDTLVTDRGLDLADIDLGDVTETELGAAGEAVFAAEPGEVVGPFPTALGSALFRMNAILSAREVSFEEAMPELREDRAAARARRVIEDQFDPITDLLAGGAKLEDVAAQTDMLLGTMEWTQQSEDGIAAYAEFREAVQELEPGAFPELMELDDGGLFAVRVNEITEPTLRPFDEAREDVIAGWEVAETRRRLLARAEALAAEIGPETEFTELGLDDAVAERDMTRRDFLNGTPPGFMATVFSMEPGEVEVVEDLERMLIVRLDSVAPPPEDDEAVLAETAAVSQRAGEGMARDLFAYFAQALQVQTDIEIDQAAINAVHANFR